MYQYMILKFGTIFIAICENHENAGHSPLCVGRKVFSTGHIVTELLSQLLRILKFSLNINFVQRLGIVQESIIRNRRLQFGIKIVNFSKNSFTGLHTAFNFIPRFTSLRSVPLCIKSTALLRP